MDFDSNDSLCLGDFLSFHSQNASLSARGEGRREGREGGIPQTDAELPGQIWREGDGGRNGRKGLAPTRQSTQARADTKPNSDLGSTVGKGASRG